jgi:hypothetical protein
MSASANDMGFYAGTGTGGGDGDGGDGGAVAVYTTATRPDPDTVEAGTTVFDTTLNQPVWSDGANWRLANGTVTPVEAEPVVLAGTSAAPPGTDDFPGNYFVLGRYTATAGTVTSVFFYLGSMSGASARVAIWAGGSVPTTRLGYSALIPLSGLAAGWIEFPLVSPAVLTAGDIWMGVDATYSYTLGRTTVTTGANLAGYFERSSAIDPPDPVAVMTVHTIQPAMYAWGPGVDGEGGGTGNVYTTVTRPDPSSVEAGTAVFDTTLNQPVWSDGANWRLADGSITPVPLPSNDMFAAAWTVTIPTNGGTYTSPVVHLMGYSTESGEFPVNPWSCWFNYTPTANGTATFDTELSVLAAGGPVNTHLILFTGSAVNSLSGWVADDDGGTPSPTSRMTYSVVAGTTYRIRMSAVGSGDPRCVLRVTGPATV